MAGILFSLLSATPDDKLARTQSFEKKSESEWNNTGQFWSLLQVIKLYCLSLAGPLILYIIYASILAEKEGKR